MKSNSNNNNNDIPGETKGSANASKPITIEFLRSYPDLKEISEEQLGGVVAKFAANWITTTDQLATVTRASLLEAKFPLLVIDVLKPTQQPNENSSGFQLLPEAHEWQNLTTCAQLGREFLEKNAGLQSYIEAASACLEEDTSQTLGIMEPLLCLALVSWDDSCLNQPTTFSPLTLNGDAISVMKPFRNSQSLFEPWISVRNDQVNHSDGDLLEVLVHDSLTLASLKTDCVKDTFLGGVPLTAFLCFVSKLMKEGNFNADVQLPSVLNELDYEWSIVPALGGSNSSLSSLLNHVAGANIGFLERPDDKDGTVGFIWNLDAVGSRATSSIMVECKNRANGWNKTELNAIFERIPPRIKCCLIFTTGLNCQLYSDTTPASFEKSINKMPHSAFQRHGVSVIVWNTMTDKADFFECALKNEDLSLWKAEQ